jgi:hypothetical protein
VAVRGQPPGPDLLDLDTPELASALCAQLPGELLEYWADHPAGSAPGRPEVHEHGNYSVLGEVVVARVDDPGQRLVAVAAAGTSRGRHRNPVWSFRSARTGPSSRWSLVASDEDDPSPGPALVDLSDCIRRPNHWGGVSHVDGDIRKGPGRLAGPREGMNLS